MAISTKKASVSCMLLEALPPELRLHIYEHLLVTAKPIRGRTARKEKAYGLHLAVLRTNKQIHDEAKSIFIGRNTFYISSIPDTGIASEVKMTHDGPTTTLQTIPPVNTKSPSFHGHFDPPLRLKDLPLLRHLTIDLLYCPRQLQTCPGPNGTGWKPIAPRATAYIDALVTLLTYLPTNLQSLCLTADATNTSTPFCAKKCLTAFFMCDRDHRFAQGLANLKVKQIPVSFELPECYFRITVGNEVFVKKSILLLACQVLFCQSQVRILGLLKEFEGCGGGEQGQGKGEVAGTGTGTGTGERTDLAPFVGRVWSPKGKMPGGVSAEDLLMAV